MRQQGAPGRLPLGRRRVVSALLAGTAVLLYPAAQHSLAEHARPAATLVEDLERLLPTGESLPLGLELENTGTRDEISQLAGTFRNSRDAAQLLASWGWRGSAYRSFTAMPEAGSATPVRVEVSLHQFFSTTGAGYALSYFAHDRADVFQHQERLGEFLLPCEATVSGDGSATRFLRSGKLVVRVTVVMPKTPETEAEATARAHAIATDLALSVLARATGLHADQPVNC
jgi:hypothetical protein